MKNTESIIHQWIIEKGGGMYLGTTPANAPGFMGPNGYIVGHYYNNPAAAEFCGYCADQEAYESLIADWIGHSTKY